VPLPVDHLPITPRSIWEAIQRLQRDVKELRATRRLEKASIGSGGMTITGGGAFVMTTATGVQVVQVGPMQWRHLDGSSQQGMILRREDGTQALSIYANPAIQGTDNQSWSWWDRSGNTVLAEDTPSGVGLALPYLPIGFAPARYTDWLATTSATYEDVHRATIKKQQPMAYIVVGHTADASGTTGQIQLTINGVAYGTPTAVGFTLASVTIGPFALPGNFNSQVELRVQAQRTAGTGNVRCQILAASGIQS
jgi:hypothetical protein